MAAAKYDLKIEQGATLSRQVQYQDENGNPIDITGMVITAQIRRTYSDTDVVADLTIEVLDAEQGSFKFGLTDEQTAALPVDNAQDWENQKTYYTWDLIIDTGSETKRLLMGDVIISPDVTREEIV